MTSAQSEATFSRRQVREERVILKNHAKPALCRQSFVMFILSNSITPASGCSSPGNHPQRRCLPQPDGPSKPKKFSTADIEGDIDDCCRGAKTLRNILE